MYGNFREMEMLSNENAAAPKKTVPPFLTVTGNQM